MHIIKDTNKYGRVDTFVPTTDIPAGYFVWNIGRHNFPHEKCIPLAKEGKKQYDWQMPVDLSSLKYIMVDTEKLALRILKEAGYKGVDRERFYEIINENK